MSSFNFDLWLEFEHWEATDEDDPEADCFNMQVRFAEGKTYALNVWTFKFVERVRQEELRSERNLSGRYLIPPDLLVERLNRELITHIVQDLVRGEGLKEAWLVPEEEEQL